MTNEKLQAEKNHAASRRRSRTASGRWSRPAVPGVPREPWWPFCWRGLLMWHVVNGNHGLSVWQQKRAEDRQLQKEIKDTAAGERAAAQARLSGSSPIPTPSSTKPAKSSTTPNPAKSSTPSPPNQHPSSNQFPQQSDRIGGPPIERSELLNVLSLNRAPIQTWESCALNRAVFLFPIPCSFKTPHAPAPPARTTGRGRGCTRD